MKNLLYTLSILLLVSSCSSINKLVEKGEYDKAFSLAIKKLTGKKNKKTKYVKGLETAFEKLNARDLKEASQIIAQNDSRLWNRVFDLYQRIDNRQDELAPILPLVSKDGYRAKFNFLKSGVLITDHVKGIETSFEKLNDMDLNKVSNLIANENPKYWDEVYEIYSRISNRQELLEPRLPLISDEGYQAKFKFLKTGSLEKEAASNAAAYLYEKGVSKLVTAKQGNKADAKEAYTLFNNIEKYFDSYKDTDRLIDEAYELGQTRILVQIKNGSTSLLPFRFEAELMNFSTRKLDTRWQKFYTQRNNSKVYDYLATYTIEYIEATPERELVNHFKETKEVSDGWDYVLDRKGNVKKDSLGNDIKKEKFKTIKAKVANVIMEKSVGIDGYFVIRNQNNGNVVLNKMLSGQAVFDEHFSTFRGDRNALSKETKRRLKNGPIYFPTDEDMILSTAEEIKIELVRELRRTFR